jgi:hypothetical protein
MIAGINNVNNSSQGFSVFRNSVTLKKSAIAGLREEDTRAMAKFGPSLVKLIVRFNVSANTLRLGKTMLCIIRSKEFTKTKNTEPVRTVASRFFIFLPTQEISIGTKRKMFRSSELSSS